MMKNLFLFVFMLLSLFDSSFSQTPLFFGRETPADFEKKLENFAYVQIKYNGGNWDTNRAAWDSMYRQITATTNIHPEKARKSVDLDGREIFDYPFIFITGDLEFDPFSGKQIETLKRFFDGGGICFVDDSSGTLNSGFDSSIKREFKKVFPNSDFKPISKKHAIYYSFHMTPETAGTRKASDYLDGIEYNNQTAVIYSHNDISGAFVTDRFGIALKKCVPGGESQRNEAKKLFINVLMYGLTGTYKLDAIHRNNILIKMKMKGDKESPE
ncbi:MAG: DUF4159 domain-containing protein [Candidatus Firestonebacteria bacterium]